jgi:RNA polymerase sigma factor (sigma-70 family)
MNYYITLQDGSKVSVTKEVYKAYYEQVRRDEYYERMKKKRHQSYDELAESGHPAEEQLFVPPPSVEEIAEREMTLEILLSALDKLSADEHSLVEDLYFQQKSETECAKDTGVSRRTLDRRREKILAKIRKSMMARIGNKLTGR